MGTVQRVRVKEDVVLAKGWATLRTVIFDYLRNDGSWQEQKRELYVKGDGAAILLYNLARRTVILTRQFRYPAHMKTGDGLLLEVPAGLLDGQSPEDCIRAEAEQETGYHVAAPRKLYHCFMSPGSVTEVVHFFVAAYEASHRLSTGGGHAHEGEDIETLEVPFGEALAMVGDGRIVDGKTIMLLHYAETHIFA